MENPEAGMEVTKTAETIEAAYLRLQERYGGKYVAWRDTYDEFSEQLEEAAVDAGNLLVEYVEPADSVSVY
jgi:hypothetical protein